MLDAHPPELHAGEGERLSRAEYGSDFGRRYAALRDADCWKLERRQHFEETDDASRDALRRGDWPEALRLLDARRDALHEEAVADQRQGVTFHRVRVVEEPLTPYIQWELHSHRNRVRYAGEKIRVLAAGAISRAESAGQLPELTILGAAAMFRVVYTDAGVPDGAVRFTDRATVDSWTAYLRGLYLAAEDLDAYFDRDVAPLPPPV
ncbi:hypothetical protein VSR01_18960 [Actinacidiphila sp. DG2A-62]|jgi:hypothetical protein|uniref:DUF6879 family protein n=1 Tax=Actinacidiphila sp. DG2A-62 TaxID=3108821 RepID=UPI002DB8728C|nr:DUF6879 family protein [Actinacidiphila sp. DG2A-62]MEC3995495.1 hypothetical protein [Actinacidiphila sp. DG2A-62]